MKDPKSETRAGSEIRAKRLGRGLLFVGVLAGLGFAATAVLGYPLSGNTDPGMQRHILVGLASTLLLLFSHCWILLYLIATGRVIRQTEPAQAGAARRFKIRCFPVLALAVALAVATFVLGAGAYTDQVAAWMHHALFFATLVAQGLALWIEGKVLDDNEQLLGAIGEQLGERLEPART